jgi:hypothetical protein
MQARSGVAGAGSMTSQLGAELVTLAEQEGIDVLGFGLQLLEERAAVMKKLSEVLTEPEFDSLNWSEGPHNRHDLHSLAECEDRDEQRIRVAFMYWGHSLDVPIVESLPFSGLNAKGKRRTITEMCFLRWQIFEVLRKQHPMTVRQVFYQMTVRGLEKTEGSYARIQQELVKMRRGRDKRRRHENYDLAESDDELWARHTPILPHIPYGWITDGTRWMRKPTTYSDVDELLQSVAQGYRRDLWEDQDAYVELWIEKDALAGVLYEETSKWDVPLMVSRGFSSTTFLYEAAEAIKAKDKPSYVYVFTDHDRSGEIIAKQIRKGFVEHAPDADITVVRVAVTAEQIAEHDLPTRPPKKKGDPPAVELDALPPEILRKIARDCIEQHIDLGVLERTVAIESQERESLTAFMDKWVA